MSKTIANRGFTLVELIVVIVIIGLLMRLFFHHIKSVREQSRRVACLSNQKEIYKAICLVGLDPQDHFHPSFPLGHLVGESNYCWLRDCANVITPEMFICPSMANIVKPATCLRNITETNSCYVFFTGRHGHDDTNMILLCDMNGFNTIPTPTTNGWGGNHNDKGGNMVFVSGAGRWVNTSEITNSLYINAFVVNTTNYQKILKY